MKYTINVSITQRQGINTKSTCLSNNGKVKVKVKKGDILALFKQAH